MKEANQHPEDFGACLDIASADPRREEIGRHLERCRECRDELGRWRAAEALFRLPELELEVPPFQWQRIQARLEAVDARAERPNPIWVWLRPRALGFGMAVPVLFFALITAAGLQYRNHVENEQLAALKAYSEGVQYSLRTAGNPFRGAVPGDASGENPFTPYQTEDRSNPFLMR